MLDLMTWSEILDNLVREAHLKKAAIFDLHGRKLAASQSVAMTETEAQAVLTSLHVPCPSPLFGLDIGGVKVNCMKLDQRSMVGRSSGEVFVACTAENVLVCGYGGLQENSSCLASVKDFVLKLNMQPGPERVPAPSLM